MPTARNTRGVDIIAYNEDCSKMISIQVKTLSKKNAVPLGTTLDRIIGDYWIIVNEITKEPKSYIMKPRDVKYLAQREEKEGKVSYWLEPSAYCTDDFHEAWDKIGLPIQTKE